MKKKFYYVMSLACWVLVFSLGLAQAGLAQTRKPEPGTSKKVRVKMIKTENGKTQVLDTTLVVGKKGLPADLLQRYGLQDVEGGPVPGTRFRVLTPPDSPGGLLPDRIWLRKGPEPADFDSVKVIYFRKNHPGGDTVLVKGRQSFKMIGPGVLETDSLLRGKPLMQLERPLQLLIVDSLVKAGELPAAFDLDPRGLSIIVDSPEIGPRIESKKGEKAVPAPVERSIVVIRRKGDPNMAPAAAAKAPKGLREDLKVRNLKYYPNPSEGRFHVSLEAGKTGNLVVQVLDPAGQVVHEESFRNFKGHLSTEIDISDNKPGIYYLRIVQGTSYLTRKVVLK